MLGVDFGECAVVSLSGVESVVFVRNISSHPPPLPQVRKSQRLCRKDASRKYDSIFTGPSVPVKPWWQWSKEKNSL